MIKNALEDLKAMALEELSRHYGIKQPSEQDVQYAMHLLSKMPMIQAVFKRAV